jgi:DNA-binding NarL/FixJ family response regulator
MSTQATSSTPRATERALDALAPLTTDRERSMLAALDTLSTQERAVFVLLGHGQRAKAIGYELAISSKTVETHIARVRAKLAPADAAAPDLADLVFLARLWVRATGSVSETS